jgi:hypothetical protein
MAPSSPRPRSRAFRLLALLCCTLLSCTTVRTHVAALPGDAVVGDDGTVPPQIDLWVESNKPLTREEEEKYRAEVRAALEQALGGQRPEGDTILVIRSQGVTRTPGHRSDQSAATVGLIVGAVVVVAAVVLAVVYGQKGGGGGHSSHASGPSLAPRGGAGFHPGNLPRPGVAPPRFSSAPPPPRPVGVAIAPPRPGPGPAPIPVPRPRPPSGWSNPGAPPRPPPFHHHGHGEAAVDVDIWVPIWLEPEPLPEPPPFVDAAPDEVAEAPPSEEAPDTEPAPPPEAPAAPRTLPLAPAEPFPMDDRGFFAGDRLRLEALVVDRQTGEVLWTKRLSRDADPRDRKAVKSAVDELLKEGGWQPPAPPGS